MLISFVKMKDEKVVVDESFTLRFEDQPPKLYPYFWDLEKAPQSPKSIKKQEPFEAKKVLRDESTQTEVFGNDLKTENENLKQRLAALEKRMEIIEEKLAKNQEPISTVENTDVTEILKGKTLKIQLQRLENMKNVKYQKPDNVEQVEQVKTSANVAMRRRKRKANPRYSGNEWFKSVIDEYEDSRDEETDYGPFPFKCTYCLKKFRGPKTLNKHIGYVHLGLKRHMYSCHTVFDQEVCTKIAEKSNQEIEEKVEEINTKNADHPPCQEPEVKVEIEEVENQAVTPNIVQSPKQVEQEPHYFDFNADGMDRGFQESAQDSAINLSTYVTNDADRINVDLDEIMARFDDFEKLA